eukprot:CAMPEP_0196729806 /NCGR_PEP_ID=MMETSP1091-20130531/10063_1 /TAXON_ID=302021 /ORGANISM="Rhodomonas sp., Strain CCMP768" /LENGTH=605 /DNA_ID=CAMNT_0042072725 /DNA_START=13 /DNA_END=1830 /DNA_ORIENTATION=+
MVASGGTVDTAHSVGSFTAQQGRAPRSELLRMAGGVMLVVAVALAMVITAEFHPQAEELLANHHLRRAYLVEHSAVEADNERLSELSRLAAAAEEQAHSASSLKKQEATKLQTSPSSKVDAETMLANEAKKKSAELFGKVSKITDDLRDLRKKLRKQNHAKREEGRLLHKVRQTNRDDSIALHDREMKVLEARHDVENAAKAGDVQILRESQDRLKSRKAIAAGARAQEEEEKKKFDQIKARARLLQKRAEETEGKMQKLKAEQHNDKLRGKEEEEASKAIGARANFLRDKAALDAARGKYKSLAELLSDKSTDHAEVEETLSKIAANIHTWKDLEQADEKDMAKKAALYKKARRNVQRKSVSLAHHGSALKTTSSYGSWGSDLLQTLSGTANGWAAPDRPVVLQQAAAPMFSYYPAPQAAQQNLQLQQQQPMAQQPMAQQPMAQQPMAQAPPAAYGQAPVQQQQAPSWNVNQVAQPAQPAAAEPADSAVLAGARSPRPAVLPGAVGGIPYVYNNKQYVPSKASGEGFPIVWLFADNKTPDTLYFGYQSADGVMHVYNQIEPHSVTRQQAFANEYWTILAADKKTVAVAPFKITQNNQWLSVATS